MRGRDRENTKREHEVALIDEVFADLRLPSVVFSRMTLRGDWGFDKACLPGAPFHLVVCGEAWVAGPSGVEPRRLGAGDMAVLSHGDPHQLLSRPGAPTVSWREVIAQEKIPRWTPGVRFKTLDLVLGRGAPETVLISGVFAFLDPRPNPLLEALPRLMVATSDADLDALTGLLDRELTTRAPGAEGVGGMLADLLFAQVVRRQLASSDAPLGWLKGLADPEISGALSAIHRTPERRWSVELLAREAGMSRSRFAARFRAVTGQAPLDYLTRHRMFRAAGDLATRRIPLAELAAGAGYESEAAFSKAFRRWSGHAPTDYRRRLSRTGQDDRTAL